MLATLLITLVAGGVAGFLPGWLEGDPPLRLGQTVALGDITVSVQSVTCGHEPTDLSDKVQGELKELAGDDPDTWFVGQLCLARVSIRNDAKAPASPGALSGTLYVGDERYASDFTDRDAKQNYLFPNTSGRAVVVFDLPEDVSPTKLRLDWPEPDGGTLEIPLNG